MPESKLKFLNGEDYWVGRNQHYGILCDVHFDSNNNITDFNTNIDIGTDTFINNVITHLVDNDYKRLVTFTRTKKEVGHPNDIPTLDTIDKLEKLCRDNSIHFYNFIQNPYPDPIYNFVTEDDTFLIRFGYDNGCLIDKHAASKDIVESKNVTEKKYVVMVTKDNIYIMDEYEK